MYTQYEKFITNYDLDKTNFSNFCSNATREEFLKSQIGFFYAVKAFPQMLCKLAAKIECPNVRLKVVENIWEEHGKGQKQLFHTQGFTKYLKSLGLENQEIKSNYFVNQWITETINLNIAPAQYAAYLAGIEYIYTKISSLICKTIKNFELLCEQNHYENHSELDFHHAHDLLDVSYVLNKHGEYDTFCLSVKRFVELFNQMTFLTHKELTKISQEKISFYYSREDSHVELACIRKQNPNILIVCSGGEHIIKIKEYYPDAKITALDINSHQLGLTQYKIDNFELYKNNPVFDIGKFELLFKYFSSKLRLDDINGIKNNEFTAIKNLEILCREIFSNKNLNIVFTDQATNYSSDDFSLHFFTVFLEKIKEMNSSASNVSNILGNTLTHSLPLTINKNNINFYNGDFNKFFTYNKNKFDLISLSNIGDWMPQENYLALFNTSIEYLNQDGALVARKLLGDYCLRDIFNNKFQQSYLAIDNTGFYTECMIGIK